MMRTKVEEKDLDLASLAFQVAKHVMTNGDNH